MHWQAHISNIVAAGKVHIAEVVVVRDQELNMKEALDAINMNIQSHDNIQALCAEITTNRC